MGYILFMTTSSAIAATPEALPDDVSALRNLVLASSEQIAQLQSTVARLKHELMLLRHWRFGTKSEKFRAAGQGSLFEDVAAPAEAAGAEEKPAARTPRLSHGRNTLPAGLPVERVEAELPPEEKICAPCGAAKIRIGEEVRRELDYVPGSLFVREYVRPVFACPRECEGQVVTPPPPSAPIEKGLPGPGLLAHVIVSKYHDHLPLARQEGIFARAGVRLARSTMADWARGAGELLAPLYEEMKREVLLSVVIHTDDTPVTVQDPKGRAKPHKGRLWIYRGDRHHPYTLYTYSPDRRQIWPQAMLSGWKGYLQADAYQGYNALFGTDMTEVACWAHARRKFVEAEKSDRRAREAIALIGELYHEEKRIQTACERFGWSPASPGADGDRAEELRRRRRRKKSKPILERLHAWLVGPVCAALLPKSPLGEAVGYARGNWSALAVFAERGELTIDNNPAENGLRPVAVGRKNYLFFGSDRGGHTAATLYSVLQSAKRHELDPWRYLRDVLSRLPSLRLSQVPELLPDRWQDARPDR